MSEQTVERATVTPASPAWGDNRSRYHFCGGYVAGKRVLDIACGTGYGSQILLEHGAGLAVGSDASPAAVSEAAVERHDHLCLIQASGTSLPFADDSFDVVVSLETIEHIADDAGFARELARVVNANGIVIFSTPNALYTRPVNGVPANPFHVREYTPDQLRELLEPIFTSVELLGQRPATHLPPCPYWEFPENLPSTLSGRIRVRWWKLQDRFLSDPVKERLSRLISRRSFYPGEHDFSFTPDGLTKGHVLVARCRP